VNVFCPYSRSLEANPQCLDPSRLGNQVYREAKTLLNGGWPHHPAARMWRGHEGALCMYALAGLRELSGRGRDYPHHVEWFKARLRACSLRQCEIPRWWGDERVHKSHRAVLLAKNFEWYGRFGWTEAPAVQDEKGRWPYFWPV